LCFALIHPKDLEVVIDFNDLSALYLMLHVGLVRIPFFPQTHLGQYIFFIKQSIKFGSLKGINQ
jgi:hypothetical protein